MRITFVQEIVTAYLNVQLCMCILLLLSKKSCLKYHDMEITKIITRSWYQKKLKLLSNDNHHRNLQEFGKTFVLLPPLIGHLFPMKFGVDKQKSWELFTHRETINPPFEPRAAYARGWTTGTFFSQMFWMQKEEKGRENAGLKFIEVVWSQVQARKMKKAEGSTRERYINLEDL